MIPTSGVKDPCKQKYKKTPRFPLKVLNLDYANILIEKILRGFSSGVKDKAGSNSGQTKLQQE